MMMKLLMLLGMCLLLLQETEGFGKGCKREETLEKKSFPKDTEMPPNLKVALIGDAGSGSEQREVLMMVKNWGADFVIHSGDFEYENDPALFEKQINDVLGEDYPYFASIGNHDLLTWSGHQRRLVDRLTRFGGDKNCTGDYGTNMSCSWKGLFFVLSGAGTWGSNHVEYADEAFSSSSSVWKLGSWHKNQRLMQIGGKFNEAGWGIYDVTRKHGAILATGHEHSFCRSHLMSDFENQVISSTNETLNLKVGESFVFVSGLAGKSIRDWNSNLISNPWWAAYGASNNGISDGGLFCTFNLGGELRKAHCTFQDRSGKVWDDFDIYSQLPSTKEELSVKLAEEERKEAQKCRSRWIEVPISSSEDDEDQLEGSFGKTLSFHHSSPTLVNLRFKNLDLGKGEKILGANLQVYGAQSDNSLPSLKISGSTPSFSSSKTVVWSHDDEEWEESTVWVSPNLEVIISDLVNQEGWERESNEISLAIQGRSNKSFHSFDSSPCLAPTLAIEVQPSCF